MTIDFEYEEPDGSVWVIAVDYLGELNLIHHPDVWEGFYEGWKHGMSGFPDDTDEVGPGVYKVTVKYRKWQETGSGEYDWEFTPVKWEPLWTMERDA